MKPSNDREAISLILNGLHDKGVRVTSVMQDDWNPDDLSETNDPDEATNLVCEVDEAMVYVDLPNGKTSFIYFVLGNDPEEVACDHGVNLSPYIDPITNPWWK